MAAGGGQLTLETPHGPGVVHLERPHAAGRALVLGHGAGGGVGAPDLQAVRSAALAAGIAVALVEQPYRVAGRRSPAPAAHLDASWVAIVAALRDGPLAGLEIVAGGRSSGARVACRTARATGVAGVVCLAFPLRPPGLRADGSERPSRQPELRAAGVPVLVVQGERDPFGIPRSHGDRRVVCVPGDHGLKTDTGAVADAVVRWLAGELPSRYG